MKNYYLSVVLLSVVTIFSLAMLVMLFSPVTVIEPNRQPYKVTTKRVQVGKQLVYVVDACKYMNVSAVVGRAFVATPSGTIYPAVSDGSHVREGCGKSPVSMTVPAFLLPGRYYLHLDITYKINALKDVAYHFKTEEFEIVR
jgi:hypothetical protein